MKLAITLGAALLLALAAFRRARGVLRPGPRTSAARSPEGNPSGLASSALAGAAIAGIAVVAVIGIVWIGLELFT
jgi:hypothetical protein